MRVLPCGDAAVLLDCDDLADAQRWLATLADHEDVEEAVLGARTVLLRGHPERLRSVVSATTLLDHAAPSEGEEVVIDVRYDGPDLVEVAGLTGLDETEVVRAHTATPWTVAFGGFAPGFAYLVGGDERLVVPRRDTPRGAVPRGAVGLAGEFSGIYPRESPGGWQLIGSTDAVMFDVDRDPAALLTAGARVRFQEAP
ncbi:allophanate hydrolase subunit 1 [Aeromicrobium sp. CF4.19]|uniref:5-oxoprolinase subunit B family protein n=1 Tax=Aeromicrobium sp. CF4.19 TaxID=3373082 RepID=UPI003EE667E2